MAVKRTRFFAALVWIFMGFVIVSSYMYISRSTARTSTIDNFFAKELQNTLLYQQQLDKKLLNDSRSNSQYQYIYHTGKNSPGGDIVRQMHNTTQLSIEDLMIECERTLGCVGFTPDGVLKRFILPYNKWTNTTHGIHTLDSNYCEIKEGHSCSPGTTCLDTLDGTYSCMPTPIATDHQKDISKEPSNENAPSKKKNSSLLSSNVHIVVSVDLTQLDGLVAMIQSVIEHTNSKDNTVIHIVASSTNKQPIENRLTCSLDIPQNVQLEFVSFELSENFKELMRIKAGHLRYLANPANFARFFFDQLFPDLSHVLYLDVDIIVQHDISVLWREVINSTALVTIAPRRMQLCSEIFEERMVDLYNERYGKNLTEIKCPNFNAGVVGFNLDKWRTDNVTDEINYWMGENSKQSLWNLGTQPVLHVVSVDDYKAIDKRWNVGNLGYLAVPRRKVKEGFILHWNGISMWYINSSLVELRPFLLRY